jgi:hypothetical protein
VLRNGRGIDANKGGAPGDGQLLCSRVSISGAEGIADQCRP